MNRKVNKIVIFEKGFIMDTTQLKDSINHYLANIEDERF